MLGRSRAIVTEIPGTTRDALEAVIDSGKWPLRLVDTAGLRETDDRIERLGIEVSEQYLTRAQVVLACAEEVKGLDQTTSLVRSRTQAPIIPVRTKADLVSNGDQLAHDPSVIPVSAETGSGLRQLLTAIDAAIDEHRPSIEPDLPILTRARHRRALEVARTEIVGFREAWTVGKLPVTVAAVHLRTAVSELEELIGTFEIEDVLDRVFSSFCVGK
jgi:tRNA modification GTPase